MNKIDVMQCASCACANLRMTTRAVTKFYDDALQQVDLTVTQFTLLTTVFITGALSLSRLADVTVMDRTSLTRTLKPMEQAGWVARAPGEDRRKRLIHLTPAGEAKLAEALPLWEQAQTHIVSGLGERKFDDLLSNLSQLVLLNTHNYRQEAD